MRRMTFGFIIGALFVGMIVGGVLGLKRTVERLTARHADPGDYL